MPCRGPSLPTKHTYLIGFDEATKEGKERGGGRGLGVLSEVYTASTHITRELSVPLLNSAKSDFPKQGPSLKSEPCSVSDTIALPGGEAGSRPLNHALPKEHL